MKDDSPVRPPLVFTRRRGWLAESLAAGLEQLGHSLREGEDAEVAPPPAALICCLADEGSEIEANRAVVREAFDVAERGGVGRVILISSLAAAGPRGPGTGPSYEGVPENPVDDRGRAYLAAEQEAQEARNRSGLALVILRAGDLFGPGNPGFWADLWGAKGARDRDRLREAWADFLYSPLRISDLSSAVSAASERGDWIYHLSSAEPETLGGQLARLYRVAQSAKVLLPRVNAPARAHPRPGRRHFRYPSHRALRELDFSPPQASCDEGLLALLLDPETRPDPLEITESGFAGPWLEGVIAAHESGWEASDRVLNELRRPLLKFLETFAARERARSVLDLGGGDGFASRNLALSLGLPAVGLFSKEENLERARAAAESDGVGHLLDYRLGDPLEDRLAERADLIVSSGDLHRFSNLRRALDRLLPLQLRPGGFLLAIEPHCGTTLHPLLMHLLRALRTRGLRRAEIEAYLREHPEVAEGLEGRLEELAPASRAVDQLLMARFEVLAVRHVHAFTPFLFSFLLGGGAVRSTTWGLESLLAPLSRIDTWMGRFPPFADHAAVACYALKLGDGSGNGESSEHE